MREKGMSQKELAAITGISGPAISRYITGTRTPLPRNMIKIAEAVGASVTDLFGGEEDMSFVEIRKLLKKMKPCLSQEETQELIKILENK